MSQFNLLLTDYPLFPFPPAYYGLGKALALLHNHSEARLHVKKGLDLLPSYRSRPLTWPGTSSDIVECIPHDIEASQSQSCDYHMIFM